MISVYGFIFSDTGNRNARMLGVRIVLALMTITAVGSDDAATANTTLEYLAEDDLQNATRTFDLEYFNSTMLPITGTPLTVLKNGNSAKLGGTIWPVKHSAEMPGDLILGGLMMVHEREDSITCGPVMPQGGVQALETMLYTLDVINGIGLLPNFTIGAHILDDCDKDTYGLEMAVDFIKGESELCISYPNHISGYGIGDTDSGDPAFTSLFTMVSTLFLLLKASSR